MKKLAELFTIAAFIIAFATPVLAVSNQAMEVPADSLEYEAVVQLAAKGYFTDYPEGLDGRPSITRGDVASMLASALPVDLTQVSAEDEEMLEMLVEEVIEELAFLGVRVRALDDVAILRD